MTGSILHIISLLSLIEISCSAIVQNFGFATNGNKWAGSGAGIELTLLYDSVIYQCTINAPSSKNTEYSCQGSTSKVATNCDGDVNEIFIENTDYRTTGIDAVIIDYIFVTDSSGNKQITNIADTCLDALDCQANSVLINADTGVMTNKGGPYSFTCSATIQNFGIATNNNQWAATGAAIELTLLYSNEIYKCSVYPTALNTEYSCQGTSSLIGTDCGDDQEMFIENTDYRSTGIDAVIIDYVFITDSNGNKQTIGVNGLCLDELDCSINTAQVNIDTGVISNKGGSYSYRCSDLIQNFGFKTSGSKWSDSGRSIELTLAYGSNVYKCAVVPSSLSTEYSCQGSASLFANNCGDNNQLFIENTHYSTSEIDLVRIEYIFITDSNGNKQTIDAEDACLDQLDCDPNTVLIDIDDETVNNQGGVYGNICEVEEYEVVPFTCQRRIGATTRSASTKSTVSCQAGETLMSCMIDGWHNLQGTHIDPSDSNTCIAGTHDSNPVFAVANCCTFPDGAIDSVTTVVGSSSNTQSVSTCSSGTVTGCQIDYVSGSTNNIRGAYPGATKGLIGYGVVNDVSTQNQCTAESRATSSTIRGGAQCVDTSDLYELDCVTSSASIGGSSARYDGGCPTDYTLVSCGSFTPSHTLDDWHITDSGYCYIQQDSYVTHFAVSICCQLRFTGACESNADCGSNEICQSNGFSNVCQCDSGYSGNPLNGIACEDDNECEGEGDGANCSQYATCTNNDGGYTCACNPGYTGDGVTCAEIDECDPDPCDPNATCQDLINAYTCTCNDGYEFAQDGVTCIPSVIDWEVSLTCDSLQTDTWDNLGTLGATADINSFTGTATSTSTNGGSLPALCFGSEVDAITYINYDTNSDVNPELTMEIWIKPTVQQHKDWLLGHDDSGYDRSIILYDNRYNGIAMGVGYPYASTVSYPAVNQWTQVVATFSESADKAIVYKNDGNGVEEMQSVDIGTVTGGEPNIGLNGLKNYALHNFVGCIAQVQIINRVLSPGEIRILYDRFDEVTSNGCDFAACAGNSDCGRNGECNTLTGFCSCPTGYEGDAYLDCANIDECHEGTAGCDSLHGICTDTDGSFECSCYGGYELNDDGKTCDDIDECDVGSDNCDDTNGGCTNTDGGFECFCNSGYELNVNGYDCDDIDECARGSDNCDRSNGQCHNNGGSFTCSCNSGYELNVNGYDCDDIDECTAGTSGCDFDNGGCTNSIGSFSCFCNAGYTLDDDGKTCNDDDECAMGTDNCNFNAQCTNTDGGFTCECNTGYEGDGVICDDIDECALRTDNCDDTNGLCHNTVGGFTCSCISGYQLNVNGYDCDDIDECAAETDNCDDNAICTNEPGTFSCECNAGYEGDGTDCYIECPIGTEQVGGINVDIPGCGLEGCGARYQDNYITIQDCLTGCSGDSRCKSFTWAPLNGDRNHVDNTVCTLYNSDVPTGTWSPEQIMCRPLTCPDGYEQVGGLNADIGGCGIEGCNARYQNNYANKEECADECDRRDNCLSFTWAPLGGDRNHVSNTVCTLYTGFEKNQQWSPNQIMCKKIDACHDNSDCGSNESCNNNACECNSGYEGDPLNYVACVNVDECARGTSGCAQNCDDTDGGYTCSCNTGYRLNTDQHKCDDINECAEGISGCKQHCSNTMGGYTCSCSSGYTLDTDQHSCSDIDECGDTETGPCQDTEICSNTIGSYDCTEIYDMVSNRKYRHYFNNPLIENSDNPNANTYSIIGDLCEDDYRGNDGKFQYKIIYTYNGIPKDVIIFKQTSWILETDIIGYEPVQVPPMVNYAADDRCRGFLGESITNQAYRTYSLLDGNSREICWFNAIGTMRSWGCDGCSPGYDGRAALTETFYIVNPQKVDAAGSSAKTVTDKFKNEFNINNFEKHINNNNDEWKINLTSTQLLVIGIILSVILLVNIVCITRKNCGKTNKKGYAVVKYDSESVDESEEKAINVVAQ